MECYLHVLIGINTQYDRIKMLLINWIKELPSEASLAWLLGPSPALARLSPWCASAWIFPQFHFCGLFEISMQNCWCATFQIDVTLRWQRFLRISSRVALPDYRMAETKILQDVPLTSAGKKMKALYDLSLRAPVFSVSDDKCIHWQKSDSQTKPISLNRDSCQADCHVSK